MGYDNTARRQDDTKLEVVLERLTGLHADVNELKESTRDSMKDIANAVNKLVMIEERQSNTNEAFNRLLNQLDAMETRLKDLEEDKRINRLVSKWVLAGVWAAAGAAVLLAAKFLGLS